MRCSICLFLITSLLLADVEIVPLTTDSDVSFVSWIDSNETAHMGRYAGDSLVVEISMVGNYDTGVGVCEFQPDSHIVLFITSTYGTECDTLITFSPTDLSRLDSRPMYGDYEHYRYGFLKNPDPRWDAFLTVFSYNFCSSITNLLWETYELSVSPSGEIEQLFSLYESKYKGIPTGADQYAYLDFCGPVMKGSGWPLFCAIERQPGGPWPSGAACWSFVHNPPVDSTYLLHDVFYSADSEKPDWPPTLMAMGSSSDDAIVLWEDADGQVMYSSFDGMSPVPVYTASFPGSNPREENCCAMSSNPEDAGMLLAWYDDGDIICRHYEGVWNDYAHIVASGIDNVGSGNIAVSSVDEGYWVAWMDDSDTYPELVFVDRDMVTSIYGGGSPAVAGAWLLVFPNPCRNILSIVPTGLPETGSCRVLIHDCSGRLVQSIDAMDVENYLTWDCRDRSGEECTPGVYFVTLDVSGSSVTQKVLLID
mgnify:CR=1 FL=1